MYSITDIFEESGLTLEEKPDRSADSAQGRLDTWNRSSGRPFNYLFTAFTGVNAIRYLANWEVNGTAKMNNPTADYQFSISVDEGEKKLRLMLGFMNWTIPMNNGSIEVVNSQPTRELVVKFKQRVQIDGGNWYMSEGSILYVRDID